MTNKIVSLAAAAAAFVLLAPVAAARAQTAYDINRLNQAMQICNSPMGAGVAECAQLRAKMGGVGGGMPGLGGGGIGSATGIAGLLGNAFSAAKSARAAAPTPQANAGMALQQAIAACVQGAGGNPTVLQACAGMAANAPAPAPAPLTGVALQQAIGACVQRAAGNATAIQACTTLASGQAQAQAYAAQPSYVPQVSTAGMLPSDARSTQSAMATYGAAQDYQACVAANPTNWQACLQTMQGNTQAGLMAAGVTPQQMQAVGLPVPGGQAGAAAGAAMNALGGFLSRKK